MWFQRRVQQFTVKLKTDFVKYVGSCNGDVQPESCSFHECAGFTLIELIVSLGLISLLLISLTSIFTASLELQLRSESSSSRQEDAQYILSRLFYDVNQASDIVSPASINEATHAIQLTVRGETWTVGLNNGNLELTTPSQTVQLNSYLTTVTQFDVKRVGNSTGKASIEVALTVGSRIQGSSGSNSVSYSTVYSKW